MVRSVALMIFLALVLGGLNWIPTPVAALPATAPLPTPSPTVYPPSQADNGAQIYRGMCMDCHGDRGQGLTEAWRTSFSPEDRDCWKSGCHGDDYPSNSFRIPPNGIPALAGAGSLARFSNALGIYQHIHHNMPPAASGSLSSKDAWSLTAYILEINDRALDNLVLEEVNAAAIPVHRSVTLPESEVPGGIAVVLILFLMAAGFSWRIGANDTDNHPKPNFFDHLHPPSIPAQQSKFRYTLGMGGLSVFFALILLVTGLLEMYYYTPTPEQAAISVQTIRVLVPYGNLIRNLHYWSAQFLVIAMTIHLLRVALTGAYAPPRRFNYLLGLGLFILILLLDFTGYILRWDEGIRWALVVGTNLLRSIPGIGDGLYQFVIGGTQIGSATLIRFYTWHILGLALIAGFMIGWHIFRVRRDGGIANPPPDLRTDRLRITRFDLIHTETLAMILTGAILLIAALIFPAPIQQPITNSGWIQGDSGAPWFFLWIQELLKTGDPFWLGVLLPVSIMIVLGLLPYRLPNARAEDLGRWFPKGSRIAQAITIVILLLILALTLWGFIQG